MAFHVNLYLIQNLCVLDSLLESGFIRIYDGTRYLTSLFLKNMMLFTLELDILKIPKVASDIFFSILRKSNLILMIPYL